MRARAKDRRTYMEHPVDTKDLGLHAKLMVVDDDLTFIGSANLDPRSLRRNTEMGLLIRSQSMNERVRELIALDFGLRNAWHLQAQSDGGIHWVSDDGVHKTQPSGSTFQKLEDGFLSTLPIEGHL